MRRLICLLALLGIGATVFLGTDPAFACSEEEARLGGCPTDPNVGGTFDGSGTDLTGEATQGSTNAGGSPGGTGGPAPFDNGLEFDENGEVVGTVACLMSGGCGWVFPGNTVVETETVTLDDIEHFAVHRGENVMQPDGWAVVGFETNFYSTARPHSVRGELFENRALVRYQPVAWHWDFGDGTHLDSETAGASWDDLGQPEFTKTETSHVFDDVGERHITLQIDFTAEYSYDGGTWTPIDGLLHVDTEPIDAVVGSATTVLVGDDCTAEPTAPGC